MRLNPDQVLARARKADTADLLDRVTVFRDGMEPEALEILEAELARRGLSPEDIHHHHQELKHRIIRRSDGLAARCSFCPRAAVESDQGWHKMWGFFPLFKRTFYYCDKHWVEKRPAANQ